MVKNARASLSKAPGPVPKFDENLRTALTSTIKQYTGDDAAEFPRITMDRRTGALSVRSSKNFESWVQDMIPLTLDNQKRNKPIAPDTATDVVHAERYSFRSPALTVAPSGAGVKTPQYRDRKLSITQQPTLYQTSFTEDEDTEGPRHGDRPLPLKFAKSFTIGDGSAVAAFLEDRLKRMQQIPVKKIVKAWIKGICPKKQALFPYTDKKRKSAGQSLDKPKWWPINACRFREPDHVGRRERVALAVHLLRLRPTAAQLKEWNGGSLSADRTHQNEGWVKFLMSLAPVSILDEFRDVSDKMTERRKVLMNQIYEVAHLEERLGADEIDDDHRFEYEEEQDPLPIKRSRQASRTPSTRHSSRSPSAVGRKSGKRLRPSSGHGLGHAPRPAAHQEPLPLPTQESDGDDDADSVSIMADSCVPLSDSKPRIPTLHQAVTHAGTPSAQAVPSMPHSVVFRPDQSTATIDSKPQLSWPVYRSFDSIQQSGYVEGAMVYDSAQTSPYSFSNGHDLEHHRPDTMNNVVPLHHPIQAYQAEQTTQPQYYTVPYPTVDDRNGMLPSSLSVELGGLSCDQGASGALMRQSEMVPQQSSPHDYYHLPHRHQPQQPPPPPHQQQQPPQMHFQPPAYGWTALHPEQEPTEPMPQYYGRGYY